MTDLPRIPIVLVACLAGSGWLLWKWAHTPREEPEWRKIPGLAGLALGAVSSALLAFFYLYAWGYHALIAHGLALWEYSFTGLGLSAVAVILGSFAVGYLRLSALMISLVAVLQWMRVFAPETSSLVDVATVVVIGTLAFASLRRSRHTGHVS